MRPITGLVLGSALVPLGLLSGLTLVSPSIANATDYRAAAACHEPTSNGNGCWTEVNAKVTYTYFSSGGKGGAETSVALSDRFGEQRVAVTYDDFNALTRGQWVTARFWKGSVVLIRIPGRDLPTDGEPGSNLRGVSLITALALLAGLVLFLGALGVHRHGGSWTRSASLAEWSEDVFDRVASPARLCFEAAFIVFCSLCIATIAWAVLFQSLLPVAAVSLGLSALGWAWLLHHRARTVMQGRSRSKEP